MRVYQPHWIVANPTLAAVGNLGQLAQARSSNLTEMKKAMVAVKSRRKLES